MMMSARIRGAALLAAVLLLSTSALPQTSGQTIPVRGQPDSTLVLVSDGCVVVNGAPARGNAAVLQGGDAKQTLVLRTEKEQSEDVWVLAQTGSKPAASGGCEGPVQKNFLVSFRHTPEVSQDALAASFNVLVAAFVLALLLESAFALLFNWRVFQVYATGKAWRTPIMLLSAYLIVRGFNFDLIAALLAAYYPSAVAKPAQGWHTSLLTAMILAGGSVGVNRILTTLGFRTQLPKDEPKEELKKIGAAWVAVKVVSDAQAQVQRSEVSSPPNAADIPILVGLTKARKPTLREIFFGDPNRVPTSGGFKLDADKFYKLSVATSGGDLYDLQGRKIAAHADAPVYRFAPGAIVDFRVTV
jgi:hypothetical protein